MMQRINGTHKGLYKELDLSEKYYNAKDMRSKIGQQRPDNKSW